MVQVVFQISWMLPGPGTPHAPVQALDIPHAIARICFWFIGLPGKALAPMSPDHGLSSRAKWSPASGLFPTSRQVISLLFFRAIQDLR
jgi:hypothetical protein